MSYPYTQPFFPGYRHPSPPMGFHHRSPAPAFPFGSGGGHHRYGYHAPSPPNVELDLDFTFDHYVPPSSRYRASSSTIPHRQERIDIDEEERLLTSRLNQLRAIRQRESEAARLDPDVEILDAAGGLGARAEAEMDFVRYYEQQERAYRLTHARAEAEAEAEAKERARIAERVARLRAHQLQHQAQQQQQQQQQKHDQQQQLLKRQQEAEALRRSAAIASQREREHQERQRQAEVLQAIALARAEQQQQEREITHARLLAVRAQAEARAQAIAAQVARARAEEAHERAQAAAEAKVQRSDVSDGPADGTRCGVGLEQIIWGLLNAGRREERDAGENEVERPKRVEHAAPNRPTIERPSTPDVPNPRPTVETAKTAPATSSRPVDQAPSASAERSDADHIAAFFKQAFGIDANVHISAGRPKRASDPTVREASSAAQAQAPVDHADQAQPEQDPAGPQDQIGRYLKHVITKALTPDSEEAKPASNTIEPGLPGFVHDIMTALGAIPDVKPESAAPAACKGKGKEREHVPAQREEAESSSAGPWAGLSHREKEESKAIERSFERIKAESPAPKEASEPPTPALAPTSAPQVLSATETPVPEGDNVKPAETLRSAYKRNSDRVTRLEQLDVLSAKLDKLVRGFTFPATLDFQTPSSSAPSSPSLDPVESAAALEKPHLRVPPLSFSHNNQPYHSQAQGLMQLLTEADAIPSEGDKQVRKARKDFVKQVEAELGRMEVQRGDIWRAQSKAAEVKSEDVAAMVPSSVEIPGEEFEQPATPAEEKVSPVNTTEVGGYHVSVATPVSESASEVIFEAPTSPILAVEEAPSETPPRESKSVNATTIEEEPEETKFADVDGHPELPAISTMEPLPAPAVEHAEPKQDQDESDSDSTRSFSSSDNESDDEEKNAKGRKKDEEFVVV